MEILKNKIATFSLGFNFTDELIEGIIQLNKINKNRKIVEVFGALADSPLNSARPLNKIPNIERSKFKEQVQILYANNISFNYLFNTQQKLTDISKHQLRNYLDLLLDIGVYNLTIGSIELAKFIRDVYPLFHQTLSITYGIKSIQQVKLLERELFDSIYLDGSFVNRDFSKIRQFVMHSNYNIRLYANLSCIANCPVIRQHYKLFSDDFKKNTTIENDNYFKGCSLVKLSNLIEFIQMPWIRPEDITVYLKEGVSHFKLSDRLSSTEILLKIAKAYVTGKSPDNLFDIIERSGDKFKYFNFEKNPNELIKIDSNKIPNNFIYHFINSNCKSSNLKCEFCNDIAKRVVSISNIDLQKIIDNTSEVINLKLLKRIK